MAAQRPEAARPPTLRRRLLSAVYELVLLVGVVMVVSLLYSVLTQQRHALHGKLGLQLVVFATLGAYFTWFWSHGGQTLAMKTWRLRLVMLNGESLSMATSVTRYALCWLPLLGSLLVAYALNVRSQSGIAAWLAAGGLSYVALAALRSDRQLLHDALSDTRVIDWPTSAVVDTNRLDPPTPR